MEEIRHMKRGQLHTSYLEVGRRAVWALFLVVALTATTDAAEAPRHLGGFVLGAPIEAFKDKVDMDTCLHVRYMEYVQEAEIRSLPGFKSGLVGFGTCADYGKILRIKLKYADGSKRFFNEMMKRLRQRFGEPDEYRGDPFHVLVAWKWSFEDKRGNRISLTMQHNTKDEEQKMGNAIKLTLTNQMEKERNCHTAKQPARHKSGTGGQSGKGYGSDDWKRFVPY
jgi:hypothetical protein